jgi:hypothetical protein
MTKIVSPSTRLLGLIANARGPLICEKISLWWVIGPSQQLREEHDEEAVFEKVVLGDLAAGGIDEVGDLLKREERDAERQDDVLQEKIGPHQGVGRIDQKIGVFEIAEYQEIDSDPEDQQQANPTGPAGAALRGDRSRYEEIEHSNAAECREVHRVPPGIEQE